MPGTGRTPAANARNAAESRAPGGLGDFLSQLALALLGLGRDLRGSDRVRTQLFGQACTEQPPVDPDRHSRRQSRDTTRTAGVGGSLIVGAPQVLLDSDQE